MSSALIARSLVNRNVASAIAKRSLRPLAVQDYLHKRKFPILGPVASWGLRAATVATLVGIYQFNTNDIGQTSSFPIFTLNLIKLDHVTYRSHGADRESLARIDMSFSTM
ncbi:hypothetical protein PHLCEN_2v6431 [Hermanssonia centrifuga]|uniref:Uncharacterized protein n=1 Tax=Hermanssonia centrifuga TaxID=98765 RepID=A0A2R6NZI0_9APHY|nr:hypothetical protein PHLCEN_2v6431 [Hermanssonia centrifuga]